MSQLIISEYNPQQPRDKPRLKAIAKNYFASVSVGGAYLAPGYDAATNTTNPYLFSGSPAVNDNTIFGRAAAGTGAANYLRRSINIMPQSMWAVASFVIGSVTTAQKVVWGLGSAYVAVGGAYHFIATGTSTSSGIIGSFRGVDGGAGINILGPAVELGKRYTVVFVVPTVNQADAFLWVNGEFYNTIGTGSANTTFSNAFAHEAIGGLYRGSGISANSVDKLLMSGYGFGVPPETFLKELSRNPWQIFEQERKVVYFTPNLTPGTQIYQLPGYSVQPSTQAQIVLPGYTWLDTTSTSGVTVSINGVSISSNTGSLRSDISTILNSSLLSSYQGVLSASSASEVIANIIGQSISSSVGNLVPSISVANGSSSISSLLGSLNTSLSLSIASSALNLNSGTIGATLSLPATSSLLNISSGGLTGGSTKSLVDSLLSFSVGSLGTNASKALQSSVISIASGFVTVYDGSLIKSISGQQVLSEQGSLNPVLSKALTGQNSAVSLGLLVGAVTKSLSGSISFTDQGSLSLTLSKNIDGSLVLTGQGNVLFSNSDLIVGINGETIISYQGNLITLGKVESSITKVIVYGTEYNLLSINNSDNIISTSQIKIIS